MIDGLRWLALEVKDLDAAAAFYREHLDLRARRADDREVAFAAGDAEFLLRRPDGVPRGGLHTHFAFSVLDGEYDEWYDRLAAEFDLHEERFGPVRSLYFYDPAGNCVELMSDGDGSGGVVGIGEVVFEVADLDRATAFYTDLGFEFVDRGDRRERVRLTAGPFDVELWEPHLGIADARGGVHVDVGFDADPDAALDAVGDRCREVQRTDNGVRVVDPDGHSLTFRA